MTRIKDSKYLIAEADELLTGAKEEMQRAREDVAAYRVCHSSRQALVNYLEAYLLNNNLPIQSPTTVDSLMEQCRNYDGRFQLIDLSPIDCRSHVDDSEYCLNVDKVSKCLLVADQVAGMVRDRAPSY
ncbi:MAG TPA: hypothetical protein VJ953_19055 [Saprospiraceae bacterium]|nr:hypothetical protein [Saprospiraceae bacterium]